MTSPWYLGLPVSAQARNDPKYTHKAPNHNPIIPNSLLNANSLISSLPLYPSFQGSYHAIHRPNCIIIASRQAESICQRSALRLVDLLRPFSCLPQVTIQPQAQSAPVQINNFSMFFTPLYELKPPRRYSAILSQVQGLLRKWAGNGGSPFSQTLTPQPSFHKKPLDKYIKKSSLWFQDKVALRTSKDIPSFANTCNNPTPWFTEVMESINDTLRYSPLELFSEPVACTLSIFSPYF